MLPVEEQAYDQAEAASAEYEKVGERECEPTNHYKAYGDDGADWRAGNGDGAERRSRAIFAGLGWLFREGFVAECHVRAFW
jgi:hypothetical protein